VWSEFPALAVGRGTIGLAYTAFGLDGIARAHFRMLDQNLGALGSAVELPGSSYANAPSVVFSGEHFVVAWALTLPASTPGDVIRVAYVNETVGIPFVGQEVRPGLPFLRHPSLLSLGADQSFLVFAGALADGAYDLHSAILNPASTLPVQVIRLTTTEPLSLLPYAARGPDGSIGIVFDEAVETEPTSRTPHFMAVGCLPPPPDFSESND
jgi:hypothetical protein